MLVYIPTNPFADDESPTDVQQGEVYPNPNTMCALLLLNSLLHSLYAALICEKQDIVELLRTISPPPLYKNYPLDSDSCSYLCSVFIE